MLTKTSELLYCKHCEGHFPPEQMRKDSAYKTGFRQQCLRCKAKSEGRSATKSKSAKQKTMAEKKAVAEKKKAAREEAAKRAKKVDTTPKLFSCHRCERDDITYEEMSKDRRKAGGVGNVCLKCRRQRSEELERQSGIERSNPRDPKLVEWVYCFKCGSQQRPGSLRQPRPQVKELYPDGALLCVSCAKGPSTVSDGYQAARVRQGLKADASDDELRAAARLTAVRQLIEAHAPEFRRYMDAQLRLLGVEQEKKWVKL